MQKKMFDVEDGSQKVSPNEGETPPAPRVSCPNRSQVQFCPSDLESALADDHRARIVWEYVEQMDLAAFYDQIKARVGQAGRPAIDPMVLLALWLYATLNGVGSAREVERMCRENLPYQWICGGVSVNYRSLCSFRVGHPEILDRLLTESVVTLERAGLVQMQRVSHDGMRVRASAGAASFHRERTIEEHLREVEEEIKNLRAEIEKNPFDRERRNKLAQERAARERAERLRQAREELEKTRAKKPNADEKENARASTTDPEARVMKMANGGFNPAFNVQLTVDTKTLVIVGAHASNSGGDNGQLLPSMQELLERYGRTPEDILVDGGYAKREDIETLAGPGFASTVYCPVQASRKEGVDPHAPRPGESATIAEWRERMATPEAQEIYKERASTVECVNAQMRNRGLQQFMVRGLERINCVVKFFALAHNLACSVRLRGAPAIAEPAS